MSNLTIAAIAIRTDAQGRYCLNDLHRAAGGEKRHQPSDWLRTRQTQELLSELAGSGNSRNGGNHALRVYQGGGGLQGTFVAKELVYAYAMWISPAFHLQVIRAYDMLVTAPVNLIPQSLPEALRLAADLAEQKAQAEAALALATPKAEALDRIATADGSMCITDAAKALQVRPNYLFSWLHAHQWIYRRTVGSEWVAHQPRIAQGVLEHKVSTVKRPDGSERIVENVRVTAKGLTWLAEALGCRLPEAA